MRTFLIAAILLAVPAAQLQREPVVRIGLNQSVPTVTVRSTRPFAVEQHRTGSATFRAVVIIPPAATRKVLNKSDLQNRRVIEIDGGQLLVLPMSTRVRIEPHGAPIEIEDRAYRGTVEV